MKRKKTFRVLFYFALAAILGSFIFSKFCWLTLYSFDEMKYNAKIVDSSVSPPNNFIKIWDKLYPESRHNGMNKQLLSEFTSEFTNSRLYNCTCDEIGYLALDNDNHKFKFNIDKGVGRYRQFGYGLQYYTTPQKCFDFWINNAIIWGDHYLKSLNELSILKLKKNVEELNQTEIVQLITYRYLGYYKSRDTVTFNKIVNTLTAKLTAN